MSEKQSNSSFKAQISLIERLLKLSRQVIDTNADYILVLEEYAELLSQLETLSLMDVTLKDGELASMLAKLEDQHLQVMSKVSSDKDKIRNELSNLKKKGKIVLTYTDQLPKRISLSTTKKV